MSEDNSDDRTKTHIHISAGTVIGPYRIIDKIGAGGMGEVFLAEDTRLKRKVALKFLPAHLAANDEIKSRFFREAQAVAKLNHPNIVTIHDVSEYEGRPYFVMEHIEGHLLHHFAHEKPLPLDSVIDYAMQVCQGIGEAHRAGVIHRDIKTTNIIVDTKGRAHLLDFGLAAIAGDERLTKTGSTLGTVAYMSPEQVSGRDIDHRSDLFSFGIVLYELVAGRTPFRRDNEGATLRAIMQDIPEPLSRYKSDIPQRLQHIVEKLLDKDRELRYQTAEDVIADLKRLVYDSQQTGHHPPPRQDKSRSRLFVGAAIVLVVAIGTVIFYPRLKSTQTETSSAMPMIAVLPFENLGNPEDEYFADGMTEEITSRLAVIEGLGVISRTSSMQYKKSGKSLSQIGKELGVNYVLEGSVRWAKVGGQPKVRITPQLIRVSDDRHMWADNYERELMEVFAVQEDIATKIVDQLGVTLLESNRKVLASRPTTNSKAYDYYLKGVSGIRRQDWTLANFSPTAANLDSAVMYDSAFALAFALRSQAYTMLAWIQRTADYERKAKESFETAFRLQPGLSYAHRAAGLYYNLIETDYDRAMEEFSHARSELHSDPGLLSEIAFVQLRQGQFAEAQENFRRATELDPLNASMHDWLGLSLRYTRSFREAEQSIDRAIALEPKNAIYWTSKASLYISRFGDWNRIKPIISEALAHCDTLEFSKTAWREIAQLHDIPVDSLLNRFRAEYRSQPDILDFYSSVWSAYYDMGDTTMMHIYLDSARMRLERSLKNNPEDPHRSSGLGVVLSLLGRCEDAIMWGKRGKELLSLAKCHW